MKIVNEKYFSKEMLKDFNDGIYFKLVHNLNNISFYGLSENFIFYKYTIEEFASHINSCYDDEGVTIKELESYKERLVYDEKLWICIFDKLNKKIVATGIAEFDKEIKEGYLEWIQVSKNYRKMGFGTIIVNELLCRLKKKANFVSVSGRLNNKNKPENLYLKCGFENKSIWHILTKKGDF